MCHIASIPDALRRLSRAAGIDRACERLYYKAIPTAGVAMRHCRRQRLSSSTFSLRAAREKCRQLAGVARAARTSGAQAGC
jgi:hypothetical protein